MRHRRSCSASQRETRNCASAASRLSHPRSAFRSNRWTMFFRWWIFSLRNILAVMIATAASGFLRICACCAEPSGSSNGPRPVESAPNAKRTNEKLRQARRDVCFRRDSRSAERSYQRLISANCLLRTMQNKNSERKSQRATERSQP
jgi:hypothetical protein